MNDDGVKQALEHLARQGMLAVGKDGIVQVRQPKAYLWQPKEDITPYELARAIELMFVAIMQNGDCDTAYDNLPDIAKRHFQVTDAPPRQEMQRPPEPRR